MFPTRFQLLSKNLTVLVRCLDPKEFHPISSTRFHQNIDNYSNPFFSSFSSSSAIHSPSNDEVLSRLRYFDRIHLNQVKILKKTQGVFVGTGLTLFELEVVSKTNEKLFRVEFQRGDLASDYLIKLFAPGKSTHALAEMILEPDIALKNLTLKVFAPPEHLIGSIYQLKGISPVVILEDRDHQPLLQLLTDGGYGWSTSAKILNSIGNEKLGDIFCSTTAKYKHSVGITIFFPRTFKTTTKVSIIGASLVLFGRIQV